MAFYDLILVFLIMYFSCYAHHEYTEIYALTDHNQNNYRSYSFRNRDRTNKSYFKKISLLSWYLILVANTNYMSILSRLINVDLDNMTLFLLLGAQFILFVNQVKFFMGYMVLQIKYKGEETGSEIKYYI